tara:strand:- start:75 stop:416 length:342 start_codon:yes stop_codon:yes gene_type:complete
LEAPKVDHLGGRWEVLRAGPKEDRWGDPKVDHSEDRWEDPKAGRSVGRSVGRWEGLRAGPKEDRWGDHLEVQMADLPMRLQAWTEALVESQPQQRGRAPVEAWGLFLLPSAWA